MSTEALEQFVRDAEDEGKEVYVQGHDDYDVIKYVEVDGVEYLNEDFEEEVEYAYWVEDAYRVAERSMY